MGYVRLRPRPFLNGQDKQDRQEFKEEIKILHPSKDVDIWFCDESGFHGDPKPKSMWHPKDQNQYCRIMAVTLRITSSVLCEQKMANLFH